jgi:transposase
MIWNLGKLVVRCPRIEPVRCSREEENLLRECDDLRAQRDRLERDRVAITAEAGRLRSLFERVKQRERVLLGRVEQLEAENKALKREIYGRKSEKSAKNDGGRSPKSERSRGQQPGNPPPARRQHPDLPIVAETPDIPHDERHCPCCGEGLERLPFDGESTTIEIHVQGYTRKITKPCYRPTCTCGRLPGIVSQPVVGSLFPGSNLGVTLFTEFLVGKFCFGIPIFRLLEQWRGLGIDLAPGTIYGLQRPLMALFEPLYDLIGERNRQAEHWHIDETHWQVLVEVPGKKGDRWWMWVFVAKDSVYFIMSPWRNAEVVTGHLGLQPEGIASVDRYSAYKAVSVRALLFLLAYCWVHSRRDFTTLIATTPACRDEALIWVDRIRKMYAANNERVAHLKQPRSAAFQTADKAVRRLAKQFEQQVATELSGTGMHPKVRKAVESLQTHMEGLMIFVEHPEIPMDNNLAENTLRPQVIIRKNSFFNASEDTAQFHVMMTSVVTTLQRNGINPRTWMMEYLQHCALAGGKPPVDINRFLPWNATPKDRERWSNPDPPRPWPMHGPPDGGSS